MRTRTAEKMQRLTRKFWNERSRPQTQATLAKPLFATDAPLELLGVEEIAEESGYKLRTVYVASSSDPDFPKPIARVKRKLLWAKFEIMDWIKQKTESASALSMKPERKSA